MGVACLHHRGDCLLAEQVADRPHSQTLLPQWEALLAQAGIDWRQIDGFAVGTGPGSFTGVRVVAATINGLNSVLQQPIHPLDSLAITALQSGHPDPIWVVEDARADELFIGSYQSGTAIVAPMLIKRSRLTNHIGALPVVSTLPRPEAIDTEWITPDPAARTQALAALSRPLRLSPDLPRAIHPQYLQPTQAERSPG